jgi:hypothetical protein
MKLLVFLGVFIWLICGLAGSWMLDDDGMQLRTIALGPISLVRGYNETAPTHPS